jgi:hypothetical protein
MILVRRVSHETPLGYRALAAEAAGRRRAPPGPQTSCRYARNDLRQLASGLLWLDKRNREATLQDRVNAILALIASRS